MLELFKCFAGDTEWVLFTAELRKTPLILFYFFIFIFNHTESGLPT